MEHLGGQYSAYKEDGYQVTCIIFINVLIFLDTGKSQL